MRHSPAGFAAAGPLTGERSPESPAGRHRGPDQGQDQRPDRGPPASVVEVTGLTKSYGPTLAVDTISFTVARGEIFGLLGPNGSGKTTTVECVQGLRHADTGAIRVLGIDPRHGRAELRRRVGSQLQESGLPDRIKVREAMRLFASLTPGAADWEALTADWGLADKRDATFASLSGGQRQRLFVALALLNRPEVVFLDEMTTGLDPAARRVAWSLISRIRDEGATVVLVTHYMDEAEELCDRIAVLTRGRIVAQGTPAQLIAAHGGDTRITFAATGDLGWLPAVPDVAGVESDHDHVTVRGQGAVVAHVGHALIEHGLAPADLRVSHPNLEDAYLRLTTGDQQDG